MTRLNAPRRSFPHTARLEAAPETLFPLFCPTREYDWIEGWSCELLHSVSGFAETGAIFRTPAPHGRGAMTWVIARHEPARAVEFACVAEGLVMRLLIRIEAAGAGSIVHWTREYTALDGPTTTWLEALAEADVAARTALLFERLAHYARTGVLLRGAS
jgi:hypothetical protein